jgi:hypothetical protein
MATLSDIRTTVARGLRDASFDTFTVSEVDDLINQGIDALADVYPKEIVSSVGTVAASVFTYSVSSFTNIYRIDVHDSLDVYRTEIPHAFEGRNSGWETHAGVLYLPPAWPLTAGDTLRAFGYGRYVQLAAATATTDLDASGIWAVGVFAQAEGYGRLLTDRVLFAQWQAQPGNTDVTALALNQLTYAKQQRWVAEQRRLRRMRKL